MGLIDGKVVLVTGAGGGMGRAGAEIFAREGARHVYVVDLKVDGGEETVELVRKQGGDGTFVAADVTAGRRVVDGVDGWHRGEGGVRPRRRAALQAGEQDGYRVGS